VNSIQSFKQTQLSPHAPIANCQDNSDRFTRFSFLRFGLFPRGRVVTQNFCPPGIE
jgi:hypothetical protein